MTKSRPPPVAVTFLDAEPVNIEKFEGHEPSSCSFWRLAAGGRTFYTVPENHFKRRGRLIRTTSRSRRTGKKRRSKALKINVRSGLREPGRSARDTASRERAEGNLACAARRSPCDAGCGFSRMQASGSNVARGSCRPGGRRDGMPTLGRPTCMALPAASEHGTITSLGCIGNRVYTGLADEEMYVFMRGKDLAAVAAALETIKKANAALQDYARARRQQRSTI